MTNEEIDDILFRRKAARERRDWKESDRLRDELRAVGVDVVDTKEGQKATAGSEFKANWRPCFYALRARIEFLEFNVRVLSKREDGDSRRIAELVMEILTFKYGERF